MYCRGFHGEFSENHHRFLPGRLAKNVFEYFKHAYQHSIQTKTVEHDGQHVLQTALLTMSASRQCVEEDIMESLVKTITFCFQNASPNNSSNMLFMPVRLPSKRRLLNLNEQHVLQTVFLSMSAG